MSKFKLIVFDIAGTTVKDPGNVANSFIEAFKSEGFEVTEEDVNDVMGFRKIEAIETVLLDRDIPVTDQLINSIHENFINSMISFYKNDLSIEAIPGAEDLFQYCKSKGIFTALNTGFSRDITDVILKRLNWNNNDLIDLVVCSDEVPQGRPAPFMIRKIMEELGLENASEIIKVGDTEVDVMEGRNAGCGLVVSITTGALSRDQLKVFGPDMIIDDLSELKSII
ncbi:MAG: HAD-IA family hydrolase [Flavitalea sp.]